MKTVNETINEFAGKYSSFAIYVASVPENLLPEGDKIFFRPKVTFQNVLDIINDAKNGPYHITDMKLNGNMTKVKTAFIENDALIIIVSANDALFEYTDPEGFCDDED